MNCPEDRDYTPTHEWVRLDWDGENVIVGLTPYDPANCNRSTRIEALPPGTPVRAGDKVAFVRFPEGVRAICAPVSGEVAAVNPDLSDHPALVNVDPYGFGWIFRLKVWSEPELGTLRKPQDYQRQIASDLN